MAGRRSPNCPAHPLGEAIEKTRAIYAQEGRDSFAGPQAVALMGYNGLNGASRRALGAVRGFGLVEGRGSQLRVSDDAVMIIADTDASDQSDRRAALLRCLRHNRVFADLFERFGYDGTMQEHSGFLQKRYQFKPVTANHAGQVFCDSLAMVVSTHSERSAEPVGLDSPRSLGLGQAAEGGPPAAVAVSSNAADRDRPRTQDGESAHKQDSFILEHGIAVLSWPKKIGREEFEDFTDWLILEHRKISRSIEGKERPEIGRLDTPASE